MLKLLATFAICFISLTSYADTLSDLDKLESQHLSCINKSFKKECLHKTLSGHWDPSNKHGETNILTVQKYFTDWIDGHSVYRTHSVRKEAFSDLFEVRSYILERDDGDLAGLIVTFRRIKEGWYAFDLQGGTSDDFIRYTLKMPRFVEQH